MVLMSFLPDAPLFTVLSVLLTVGQESLARWIYAPNNLFSESVGSTFFMIFFVFSTG